MSKKVIEGDIWTDGEGLFFRVTRATPRAIFGNWRNGPRGRYSNAVSKVARPALLQDLTPA